MGAWPIGDGVTLCNIRGLLFSKFLGIFVESNSACASTGSLQSKEFFGLVQLHGSGEINQLVDFRAGGGEKKFSDREISGSENYFCCSIENRGKLNLLSYTFLVWKGHFCSAIAGGGENFQQKIC